MIEGFRVRREHPCTHRDKAPVWPEEEGSQEGCGRARRSTDKELHRKLDADGGNTMIFKMARDRTEDGRDVEIGAVIDDTGSRLITESKEVLIEDMGGILQGATELKRSSKLPELPHSVRREGKWKR